MRNEDDNDNDIQFLGYLGWSKATNFGCDDNVCDEGHKIIVSLDRSGMKC